MECQCKELADRMQLLEAKNVQLQSDVDSLRAKIESLVPDSPELMPFPSIGSPMLAPQTKNIPKSPSIVSKVSSRMHRILQKPDQSHGPVTMRRNSNTARPTIGQMSHDSPELTRSSPSSSLSSPSGGYHLENSIVIPEILREGITFLRVTHNKKINRVLKLDQHNGVLTWNSKLSSRLSLDRICDIYTGEDARNYREEFKVSSDVADRWATIIHQRPGEQKVRALHLVIATKSEFTALMTAITQLLNFRREMMSGLTRAGSHFVDVHWHRAANNERITFDEFTKLAKQLHINCSRHFLLKVFTEADIDASGSLDFEEFKKTVEILRKRDDILAIYSSLVQLNLDNGVFGRHTFEVLFRDIQNCPEKIEKSWTKYAVGNEISEQAFTDILTSSNLFPATVAPLEDLDRPITEYWISSSHNTYLTGKQVGFSDNSVSVEGYIRSLQDGCRCIEIDLWDGSNGPVVCHGSSVAQLTNSIEFVDVVHAIRKYGFISSPYPLILSLEVHCNHDNQLRVVGALKNILGERLLTRAIRPHGFELPSPNDLKHKVLVKVKVDGTIDATASTDSEEMDLASRTSSNSSTNTQSLRSKIVAELGDLGVYLSARKYQSFITPDSKLINHCFSFSERTVRNLLKTPATAEALVKHNRKYFARVYPSAFKISSKNFDPMLFWQLGFQMVALNWQTYDLGMQLNNAFHSANCGYVHKPAWMHPSTHPVEAPKGELTLAVTLISAQQLPRPKDLKADAALNPSVVIEKFGSSNTDVVKLPQINDNGFNPQWNKRVVFQVGIADLEFACLRFSIYQNEDTLFAATTVKVKNLCMGYRHLSLQDGNGEDYLFSSLFIKTELS